MSSLHHGSSHRTRHLLWLACVFVLAPACAREPAAEPDDGITVSDEIRARTEGRRERLAQLANVDALARLYLGRQLDRRELLALGTKDEASVIAALSSRPDFREQYATRIAEFAAVDGRASASSADAPPDALLDAFGGDEERAARFARWLARGLAPLAADAVIAEHGAAFKSMTYRELLDALRAASARNGGAR